MGICLYGVSRVNNYRYSVTMGVGNAGFKGKSYRKHISVEENKMLMASPLLSGHAPALQEGLLQMGEYRSYNRGEFLFMDNDPIDYVHYIFSGKMREYYCSGDGSDCLRCLHTPGSYISLHMAMSQEQVYPYSCEVIRRSTIFTWKAKELKQIIAEHPELSQRTLQLLSGYVEASCRKVCLCRKSQAVSRVAGYLLGLDEGYHTGCPCYPSLSGSRSKANIRPFNLTASDVCLARETFSRAVSQLQEQNLIAVHQGQVDILDPVRLKKVSEGE